MSPVVHHPHYRAELAAGHRFPMNKYEQLARLLIAEGIVAPDGFIEPEPADAALLAAATTRPTSSRCCRSPSPARRSGGWGCR